MKQGMIIYLLIGFVAAYFLVGFVNKLHDENDALLTKEKAMMKADMQYYQKDVVGNTVLVLKGLTSEKKYGVWKRSPLYHEMIELFPDFGGMKAFINDRIIDDELKSELLQKLDRLEDDFFSGRVSEDEAKEALKQ